MKKVVFLLIINNILIQTNFSQQNIFPSNGNVGIGTTSPQFKLEVNGALKVETNTELRGNVKMTGVPDLGEGPVLGNGNQSINQYKFLVLGEDGIVRRINPGIGELGPGLGRSCGNSLNNFNVPNPSWSSGMNKIYSSCQAVNIGINTDAPRVKLDVLGATYSRRLFLGEVEPTENEGTLLSVKAPSSTSSNTLLVNMLNSSGSSVWDVSDNGLVRIKNLQAEGNIFSSDLQTNKIALGTNLQGSPNSMLVIHNTSNQERDGIVSVTQHSSDYRYNTKLFVNRDFAKAFVVFNTNSGTDLETFKVYGNGKTQIGKETQLSGSHTNSMLSVSGKIVAQSMYITMSNWADHVFDETYQAMPLAEVEKFYKAHHHLPEIPSEKEIIEGGLNVSEMNRLLLKKIEELTILLVEQDKRVRQLEEK